MTDPRYTVENLIGNALHADGAHAGRACVAVQFGDRGEHYTARQLVERITAADACKTARVMISGANVWSADLAVAIRGAAFRVHAEIDGTRALVAPVDWLVVAPVVDRPVIEGLPVDEVKVVVDARVTEDVLDAYAARWRCEYYFLVPDGSRERAISLIRARPRWRLSVPL